MHKPIRLIFFLAFLTLTQDFFGQDLIVKKGGEKISCEIQSIDTLSIYYIKDGTKFGSQISKADVESYYVSDPVNVIDLQQADTSDKIGNEKLLFGVSFGRAKPTDVFGSKNINKPESGLANQGFVLGFNAVYKASEIFGLKMRFHYQVNSLDEGVLQADLDKALPASGMRVTAGDWRILGAFGGFRLSAPINDEKKLYIDVELLAGYPQCSSPEIVYRTKTITNATIQSAKIHTMAFLPELGLRYSASKEMALSLSANYLYLKPTFDNVATIDGNGGKNTSELTQEISSVNVQFGIILMFY